MLCMPLAWAETGKGDATGKAISFGTSTTDGATDPANVEHLSPEERTRMVTITTCGPESRTHPCPLTLQLDGLAAAEPEVLAALAQHHGNLHLAGLKMVSIEGARRLTTHKGGTLTLDGLVILTDQIAAILSTHDGPLSLKGVKQTSEQALAVLEGRSITLSPELKPTPHEKD